jgi:hypothetical protein
MVMLRLDLLALDTRRHRGSRSLRVTALEIGISAATLYRVEHCGAPDLESFGNLCRWLSADPNRYLGITRAVGSRSEAGFLAAIEHYVESGRVQT